ncbi:hypothetical protein [Schlesneria paludicola]|uniref:hypothetical protein n=1 Tax=Schlesneria paludicola TaxID=360056 RepID=UPI00029B0F51|nr:hypothetical protein [Schlesneria paludicola]
MNETVLLKLMEIVERAVRPVQSSLARKKKIREELLAHVTGVFEDELPRCGEAAAFIQAEKRLGEPSELAQQLQESVPKCDRFSFLLEQLFQPRIGESLIQRAGRYGMLVCVIDSILSIALSLLIFPVLGMAHQLGTIDWMLLLAAVSFGVIAFVATLLMNGLERTLFCETGRSPFKAGLLTAACIFVPLLLPTVFSIGMSPFVDDNSILGPSTLWGALPASLLAPFVFISMAKRISDEKRYLQEWSKLQVN